MQVSPMLPTAAAFMPASHSKWQVSAVVVVLPLVPVMATHFEEASLSRQANSTSLITSAEAAAALR